MAPHLAFSYSCVYAPLLTKVFFVRLFFWIPVICFFCPHCCFCCTGPQQLAPLSPSPPFNTNAPLGYFDLFQQLLLPLFSGSCPFLLVGQFSDRHQSIPPYFPVLPLFPSLPTHCSSGFFLMVLSFFSVVFLHKFPLPSLSHCLGCKPPVRFFASPLCEFFVFLFGCFSAFARLGF